VQLELSSRMTAWSWRCSVPPVCLRYRTFLAEQRWGQVSKCTLRLR